eukprot:scaffold375_cov378-Prasinococcus_capsulatus_cf.AAC.22
MVAHLFTPAQSYEVEAKPKHFRLDSAGNNYESGTYYCHFSRVHGQCDRKYTLAYQIVVPSSMLPSHVSPNSGLKGFCLSSSNTIMTRAHISCRDVGSGCMLAAHVPITKAATES